jgi:hypothetical protein
MLRKSVKYVLHFLIILLQLLILMPIPPYLVGVLKPRCELQAAFAKQLTKSCQATIEILFVLFVLQGTTLDLAVSSAVRMMQTVVLMDFVF